MMDAHAPALFKQAGIRLTCEMMSEYKIPKLEAAMVLFSIGHDLLEQLTNEPRKHLYTSESQSKLKQCCKDAVLICAIKTRGTVDAAGVGITCLQGHLVSWNGKTWTKTKG